MQVGEDNPGQPLSTSDLLAPIKIIWKLPFVPRLQVTLALVTEVGVTARLLGAVTLQVGSGVGFPPPVPGGIDPIGQQPLLHW